MLHSGSLHPSPRTVPVQAPRSRGPIVSERDQDRATIIAWLDAIRARFRVEVPEIARRAKVSASTIYRWYDVGHPFSPSLTSIRKIAQAFDVPMPEAETARPRGFEEGDAQPVIEQIKEILAGDNQGVWRLTTRALELAGYLPGDMLLVDMTVTPRAGDVVAAQVYNLERGTAETKLRVYEAPFLTTRTMDPAAVERPLFVDNERVHIAGTVVRSLRVRS